MSDLLTIGANVKVVIICNATILDISTGHGKAYKLKLPQNDYMGTAERTVWVDDLKELYAIELAHTTLNSDKVDYIPHSLINDIRSGEWNEHNGAMVRIATQQGDYYTDIPFRTTANGIFGEFYKNK